MRVLFCSDPMHPRAPDQAYESEHAAAVAAGFQVGLIDYEALVEEGDAERAVRMAGQARPGQGESVEQAIYRGWMLRPEAYDRLHGALEGRGLPMLTGPAAYRHCHLLPESYPVIEAHTAKTVWLASPEPFSLEPVMRALAPFGGRLVVVKDFVKSRKHEWAEACFIPASDDAPAVERVVRRFLALLGTELVGGLVFREFLDLEPLARHPRSGMPLSKEFRTFVFDGVPFFTATYWEEGDSGELPDLGPFASCFGAVESRFFTADVARERSGRVVIVELGDAQVSGLPETAEPGAFFLQLAAQLVGRR